MTIPLWITHVITIVITHATPVVLMTAHLPTWVDGPSYMWAKQISAQAKSKRLGHTIIQRTCIPFRKNKTNYILFDPFAFMNSLLETNIDLAQSIDFLARFPIKGVSIMWASGRVCLNGNKTNSHGTSRERLGHVLRLDASRSILCDPSFFQRSFWWSNHLLQIVNHLGIDLFTLAQNVLVVIGILAMAGSLMLPPDEKLEGIRKL